MNMKLLFAVFAALLAQSAVAANPSRAAQKGCAWEKISDAKLGLEAWVQRCDFGYRKISLFAKNNALMSKFSDGGEAEALIEVFDLSADETPEAGIKRVFAEHTQDKSLVARCELKPYKGDRAPAGVKRFTFLPNAALKKEWEAKTDPGDIPEPACGEWGDAPDGIQYFEAQPASGARRVMFVRAGQDEPLFDEKTLHLLPTSNPAIK